MTTTHPKTWLLLAFLVSFLVVPSSGSTRTTFSDGSTPINVGEIDPSFSVTQQPNGKINAMLVLSDGRLLVGGEFTKCGNIEQSYLAMFNPDGSLVTSFTPQLNGRVNDLDQNNGQIFNQGGFLSKSGIIAVGGAFTEVNGRNQGGIAFFENSGAEIDLHCSPGFNGEVNSVLSSAQHNGLIIGGQFSNFNDQAADNLANLFLNLSSSPSIRDYKANGPVYTIETSNSIRQSGDIILIGGDFTQIGDRDASYLAELDHPYLDLGTFDGPVREIDWLGDLEIIVRGDFTTWNDVQAPGVVLQSAGYYSVTDPTRFLPQSLNQSPITSIGRGPNYQFYLGHSDGSVSNLRICYNPDRSAHWLHTSNFATSGSSLSSAVTSCVGDQLVPGPGGVSYRNHPNRIGYASYHASASGEIVRLYGLHGSTVPPPPPPPQHLVRNNQLQAFLYPGLSLLEQECEISGNDGDSWASIENNFDFLTNTLLPNHRYLIRARYRNSNGIGPYSEPVEFTTPTYSNPIGSLLPANANQLIPIQINAADQGKQTCILVHGIFSGHLNGNHYDSIQGVAQYNSDFVLTEFKSRWDLGSRWDAPALALSDGSHVYLSSNSQIEKRTPILESDPAFLPIPLEGELLAFARSHSPAGFMIAEYVASDPAQLKLSTFSEAGETILPAILIDDPGRGITRNLDSITQTSSGKLFLGSDYSFEIDTAFPSERIQRVIVGNDGTVSPVRAPNSEEGNVTLFLTIEDGSNEFYLIDHSLESLDPIRLQSFMSRTDDDGILDEAFTATFSNLDGSEIRLHHIKKSPNNQLLVVGYFTHCNGILSPNLVLLNQDGTVDETFSPPLGLSINDWNSSIFAFQDNSFVVPVFEDSWRDHLILLRGSGSEDNTSIWKRIHGFESYTPNADTDGDGLTHQVELLYGLDPHHYEIFDPLQALTHNGHPSIRLAPPVIPIELPQIESSSDLINWQSSPLQPNFTLPTSGKKNLYRLRLVE